jgi:putative nucleotidyltransferase with HDIG domain
MESSEKNRTIGNDIPDNVKMEVSSFPSMPQAAVKLRALLKEDDVPMIEIENILRQDPGLSTNVLRLANSAHFGLSSKVGSLKQAVMLLGVKRFGQIAFSACMNKAMDKAVEGYDLSPGELWLHSIAVATTAEALAKIFKIADSYDVFTPALLHDMGKLVLGKFVKEESKQIESIVSQKLPLDVAENMVLGTNHAEIGALILDKWSFPTEIVNAVRWHHDPGHISKTDKRLKDPSMQSDVVYLSNLIFQSNSDSNSDGETFAMPSSEVVKRLGITIDQYRVIAEKAHRWKNELSGTLSFE